MKKHLIFWIIFGIIATMALVFLSPSKQEEYGNNLREKVQTGVPNFEIDGAAKNEQKQQ